MGSYGYAYYAIAHPTADEVLIAARPYSQALHKRGFVVTYTGISTDSSARITVAEGGSGSVSPVGQEFMVYYFSTTYKGNSLNHHAGLEVYNEDGDVVFSSERKYLIPEYAQFGTMEVLEDEVRGYDSNNVYYSWLGRLYKRLLSPSGGRTYAVAQALAPWYNWYYNPQTGGEVAVLGFCYKDDDIWLCSFPIYNSGGRDLTVTAPAGWRKMQMRVNYLVVDVTNL